MKAKYLLHEARYNLFIAKKIQVFYCKSKKNYFKLMENSVCYFAFKFFGQSYSLKGLTIFYIYGCFLLGWNKRNEIWSSILKGIQSATNIVTASYYLQTINRIVEITNKHTFSSVWFKCSGSSFSYADYTIILSSQ